jgi:Zn-dependent protease with chaperone function
VALAMVPANLVLWPVSRLVETFALGLALLDLRDSQRAEYLADASAAHVAGTASAIGLTEALHLGGAVAGAAQRACVRGERGFFDELRAHLAAIPERERERLRRAARAESSRLHYTHPPTAHRLAALEAHPVEPELVLDDARAAAVAAELATREAEIGRRVVDRYRERLYA